MESYEGYRRWKDWSEAKFAHCDQADARYFAEELARAGVVDLAGCRILEIGFGNGSFAAFAREAGADYCGVEVIEELVALGRGAGFKALHDAEFRSQASALGSFACVVAFDVFEHLSIEKLKEYLAFLLTRLEVGGILLARVPSGDSPFSRAIQHGDLTHLSTLGSSAVRQLATQLGCEVVVTREPVYPLRGAGAAAFVRRAVIRALRPLFFGFIRTVLMGNRDAVLTPNMVFGLVRAK